MILSLESSLVSPLYTYLHFGPSLTHLLPHPVSPPTPLLLGNFLLPAWIHCLPFHLPFNPLLPTAPLHLLPRVLSKKMFLCSGSPSPPRPSLSTFNPFATGSAPSPRGAWHPGGRPSMEMGILCNSNMDIGDIYDVRGMWLWPFPSHIIDSGYRRSHTVVTVSGQTLLLPTLLKHLLFILLSNLPPETNHFCPAELLLLFKHFLSLCLLIACH